jgi:transposase-like protein
MIPSAAKLNRRSKGDFKRRNSEAALNPQAISRYPRQLLSYRDIKALLLVQRLEVDCSALNRWVLV